MFARYLIVTIGLVSQWERGEKHPQGPSLKPLSLVAKGAGDSCVTRYKANALVLN